MTDLEKVLKLQEKIKAGDVAVADFTKYSTATKQTFYNLRDDKVSPEKMTVKMAESLAVLYDILFPTTYDDRSYKWGQLMGLLDTVHPINENDMRHFGIRPMSTYKVVFERYFDDHRKKMIDLEDEIRRLTILFSYEEFSDEPLEGKYFIGFQREKSRLEKMAGK